MFEICIIDLSQHKALFSRIVYHGWKARVTVVESQIIRIATAKVKGLPRHAHVANADMIALNLI